MACWIIGYEHEPILHPSLACTLHDEWPELLAHRQRVVRVGDEKVSGRRRKEDEAMFGVATWPRSLWTAFDELESLQSDVNRLLSDWDGGTATRRARPTYPLLNVWSGPDGLVIDADLPGVEPKDVDVSVLGDELTLRGKVNVGELPTGEVLHRRERRAGEFVRTLQLPFRADSGGVKANYRNGVLRLTVPRSAEEKPKKVAIEG
jgi:HSP20 family protein